MTPLEAIVTYAKPHGAGYAADLRRGYDAAAQYPLLTRAWWSAHPINGIKAPVVWPPVQGDAQ
ncbi:hypothetical protein [Azospirillum sp. TSO5]|uniref:hypothetical protein n=1 Tax=Azospirillum sp. TSO5 TaxID=716760 RepID=UPI000D61379F|nr:hypothetical protein [Azospirillum sp. TSO5]PWC96930.1 hypothetical protein TSO5_05730 [Azospirillum sp. TSO5]